MIEISVVLPNFNGSHLLARNLPSLFQALEGYEHQVIVVDDASTDDSVKFLRQGYPQVTIVEHIRNKGFSATCNTGLGIASGRYVCIANTDVEFSQHYFQNILPVLAEGFFAAKGPIQNISKEGLLLNVDVVAKSFIRRGFWRFNKKTVSESTSNFSANLGGAFPLLGCCFVANTEKLQNLGGFDEIFSPYYWEDSDLPFRALRAGERLAYVPQAKVSHQLSSTINTNRSKWKRKLVSDRNKFIFTWRHLHSRKEWLGHLGYQALYFPVRWLRLDWSYYLALIGALYRVSQFKYKAQRKLKGQPLRISPRSTLLAGTIETSLIVSVYKDAEKLECILRSLCFQTAKNFEVIVSEDGQSSEISACIARFKHSPFPLKHLTQEDRGFQKTKALNQAVRAARADYLIFIDGDCVPHPRFIESHFENRQSRVVLAGRRVELGKTFSQQLVGTPRLLDRLSSPWGLLKSIIPLTLDGSKNPESGIYSARLNKFSKRLNVPLLGCNFSCFRSSLEMVNGFNEEFRAPGIGEDTDLEWRLLRAGERIQSVKFLTPLFHLWHDRNYPLSEENVRIFEETKRQDHWLARLGLFKRD
jgi:GT2 family glycosyltransferase